MKNYVPRVGSVPARLIAHMRAHGGSIDAHAAAELLGIDRKNVDGNMATAVRHGLLTRDKSIYTLVDNPAPEAQAETTAGDAAAWGGASRPAFPMAPPRASAPEPAAEPPRMRTLKAVAADLDFHAKSTAPVPRELEKPLLDIEIHSSGTVVVSAFPNNRTIFTREQMEFLIQTVTRPYMQVVTA